MASGHQKKITLKPIRIEHDADEQYMKNADARFLKNYRVTYNKNEGGADSQHGQNAGVGTRLQSNKLVCNIQLPTGKNMSIGAEEFEETNEVYFCVWNENKNHTIVRINNDHTCDIVISNSCLGFTNNPKYTFNNRMKLSIVRGDDGGVIRKNLILTNGDAQQLNIDVEAAIATNGFSTNYFKTGDYTSCCNLLAHAVVAPMSCPNWKFIVPEKFIDCRDNFLYEKSLQISFQYIYHDGRTSSVSPYSLPIELGQDKCGSDKNESPNCALLNLNVGNALVQKINIFVRNCKQDWYLYDVLDKHTCDSNLDKLKYWENSNSWEGYNYDKVKNTIEYEFCNNKQCAIVDQAIFTHVENSIPFKSYGIELLEDRLLLANNLEGGDNLSCEQVESFSIDIQKQDNDDCDIKDNLRDIAVWMIIRNDTEHLRRNGKNYPTSRGGFENQFLFGDARTSGDVPINGNFYFGGFGYRESLAIVSTQMKVYVDDNWKAYQQYVPSDDGGFVGYLAGTSYIAVSEQYKLSGTSLTKEGIIYRSIADMTNSTGSFDSVVEGIANGDIYLQKFTFKNVIAGNYIFRVGGHREGTSAGFEQTSTYIDGSEVVGGLSTGNSSSGQCKRSDYEWVIDVCEKSYDSAEDGGVAIKLLDGTLPQHEQSVDDNKFHYNLVRELYLYEDENHSIPIEGQQLHFNEAVITRRIDIKTKGVITGGWGSRPHPLFIYCNLINWRHFVGGVRTKNRCTDHNGFVFHRERFWRSRVICPAGYLAEYTEPVLGTIGVTHIDGCSQTRVDSIPMGITAYAPIAFDFFGILPKSAIPKGLHGTQRYSAEIFDKDCSRVYIEGDILDKNGDGIGGISVSYTKSQSVKTDAFGRYKLVAHRMLCNPSRQDDVIISNLGGACVFSCDGCKFCCPELRRTVALPPCINCEEQKVILDDIILEQLKGFFKGLKGRYGFGVAGWDCYGRLVTGGVNNFGYYQTPECWNKPPIINWNWSGVKLPSDVRYITFFRTKNLKGSILQWIGDTFEYVDKDGVITSSISKAESISVSLDSLLNYNEANSFGVNSSYQFVDGDILKVYKEDCTICMEVGITGVSFDVKSASDEEKAKGFYITVPFDNRFNEFIGQCNLKIEIIRPYECENSLEPYFEICNVIKVNNGVLEKTSGVLETWDTYQVYRTYPVNLDCDKNPNYEHYFSNFPSDFWGGDCGSNGRVATENPYAQRKWVQGGVATSNVFGNNGAINGLATFWDENKKEFKGHRRGGIVAVTGGDKIIFCVCENNWFTLDYNMNYAKMTNDGLIVANLEDTISEPRQKIGEDFGCAHEDANSIIFDSGTVAWVDRKRAAIILSDYRSAIDITNAGMKGYLSSKIKHIAQSDNRINDKLSEVWDITAIKDAKYGELIFTFRNRDGLEGRNIDFVNTERNEVTDFSETWAYNVEAKSWVRTAAYTPECYGIFRSSIKGENLIAFANGLPYTHNDNDVNTYNTFFGVKTEQVLDLVAFIPKVESEVNIYQSLSIDSDSFKYFVDRIFTDEKNSNSYIPSVYFKRKENMYYAEILRDASSYPDDKYKGAWTSALIDGKRIFGKWLRFRIVSTPEGMDGYDEIDTIDVQMINSEINK